MAMLTFVADPLAHAVIGSAIEVHQELGPGLLESAYQRCLAYELTLRGIPFVEQMPLPVLYKGLQVDCSFCIDFIVDGRLLLELKTAERILPIHRAQILTYLKLLNIRQGLLMNFNSPRLVDGVKSFLNDRNHEDVET